MSPPQTPFKSPCRCRLELSGHYVNAVQLHVHAADVLVRRGIWRGLQIIQEAVGHRCDTSTAIYTHVSGDFMNTALRKALAPALDGQPG